MFLIIKKVIVEIHIAFTHNVFENHTHSSKMFFFYNRNMINIMGAYPKKKRRRN